MAFHWDDPEWKAEWLRKKAEARARKAAFTVEAEKGLSGDAVIGSAETPTLTPIEPAQCCEPQCWVDEDAYAGPEVRIPETQERLPLRKVGFSATDYPCPNCGHPAAYFNFADKAHDAAIALLRRFYAATRLRSAAGGWQPGKCAACNVPHPRGICPHACVCHEAAVYLADLERVKEAG